MGNKTECTGFLARTTIKPETKAGLDKTESIMVRRPSLKWNLKKTHSSRSITTSAVVRISFSSSKPTLFL
jgi:hypothetical protein